MSSLDLLACGDSITNLKLILSFIILSNSSISGYGEGNVLRFDGVTGDYEDDLAVIPQAFDIALATDSKYSASGSNPSSLGCIFSFNSITANSDSIFFKSSGNGGLFFDNKRSLAGSKNSKLRKVALAYGRSLCENTGRYYAVWENMSDYSSSVGNIYTSHSDPNYNSPFTSPVKIDSLTPETHNNARNPSIACQVNSSDNDSIGLTEIILFEKYLSISNSYSIQGFYNMRSTLNSNFSPFALGSSSDNWVEPSVMFNPFDSTFMVTYFNSTTKTLPFLRKNFNMNNPDLWEFVTTQFNDSTNIANPSPKIALSFGQHQGALAWNSEGSQGNGISLFDAQYLITGQYEVYKEVDSNSFTVYPNPCRNKLNINLSLVNPTKLAIKLYSIIGQPITSLTNQNFNCGKHIVSYDISAFPAGCYLINITSNNHTENFKIIIEK